MMSLSFEGYAVVPDNVRYYVGASILSVAATGEQRPSEKVAVKRTVSRVNSRIVEIACVAGSDGKYRQSPVYIVVNRNRVTVSDNQNMRPGLIEGNGFVLGDAWNWKYLVLDMKTKFGGHTSWVYDINVMIAKEIYAVKSIYPNIGTNEEPIRGPEPTLLMTVRVKRVDRNQYRREIAVLGCAPN
jgi:hypothetical protein